MQIRTQLCPGYFSQSSFSEQIKLEVKFMIIITMQDDFEEKKHDLVQKKKKYSQNVKF